MRGMLCIVGLVVCASLGLPGPAVATTTPSCTYDASTHTVTMDGYNGIDYDPSGAICGGGTYTNTDTIDVTDPSDLFFVTDPELFAPGAGGNPDHQIHWSIDFTNGTFGVRDLVLTSAVAPDPVDITVGQNGIGLNSSHAVDMTLSGFAAAIEMQLDGSATGTLSGAGGGALGNPATAPVYLRTTSPGSTLIGGAGDDGLGAYAAHVTAQGGKGDDLLSVDGDTSHSRLIGGAGTDQLNVVTTHKNTLSYAISLDGQANDGALPGNATNNVLSIENVYGGPGNDSLVGNDASNLLSGGGGNDTITGGGGPDTLVGGGGSDTFFAQNGVRDIIKGGAGGDTATVDCGLDHVAGVETMSC